MSTMTIQEAKQTAIQAAEDVQAIPVPFRTGLPKFFEALALAASLGPALAELERARLAQERTIAAVQAAEGTRQAAADAAFAAAEATRRSTLADLEGKVEAARQTLANLDGQVAEARATIARADELRADVRSRAARL